MQPKLANDLKEAVGEAEQEGDLIDLSTITTFEWEWLYIFTPYTPEQVIHRELGFEWDHVSKSSIRFQDNINLLVFVRDEKVIQHLEYPRNDGDFYRIDKPGGFAPEEAIFKVIFEDHGTPWKVLVWAEP